MTPTRRADERRPDVEALKGLLIATAISVPLWGLMIGVATVII